MDQPFSAPEHFLASDAAGVAGDFILKCGFACTGDALSAINARASRRI